MNPTLSSTRYCRLINFEFTKETEAKTVSHFEVMQADINNLQETKLVLGNVTFLIKHSLFPCMVDGKICSVLASTSSARCHVCGAYPVEMNKLDLLAKRVAEKDTYKFGLSPLHFRIRYTYSPYSDMNQAALLTYYLFQVSRNDSPPCLSARLQGMEV